MPETSVVNPNVATNLEAPSDLLERSRINVGNIQGSYIDQAVMLGQFETPEAAQDALKSTEALVARDHKLTINMSADSLDRFLSVGQVETMWDYTRQLDAPLALGTLATINSKDTTGDYEHTRLVAEEGLRQYAPADATRHEPFYAALAGPREHKTGAAPSYGNYWLEVDPSVAERAVYVFSDSHAAVKSDEAGKMSFDDSVVLGAEDAVAAKAVVDLASDYHASLGLDHVGGMVRNADPDALMTVAGRRPGYIEAVLFDPIKAENVIIGMALKVPNDLADAGRLFRQHPELTQKAKAYCSEGVSDVVTDWLARRLPTELNVAEEAPRAISQLWEQIGLSPDATIEEVDEALKREVALTYRDLVRYNSTLPRIADFHDGVQWDGYIKYLQAARRNLTGEEERAMGKLIDMQQARVFFAGKQ